MFFSTTNRIVTLKGLGPHHSKKAEGKRTAEVSSSTVIEVFFFSVCKSTITQRVNCVRGGTISIMRRAGDVIFLNTEMEPKIGIHNNFMSLIYW